METCILFMCLSGFFFQVMAAYHENGSSKPETEESLLAKFNKKINKNSQLKVFKDRVKLK